MKRKLQFVYVSYALSFVIVMVIYAVLYRDLKILEEKRVEHTLRVKNQIANVKLNLIEAENSLRGFLLSKDSVLLVPVTTTQKQIYHQIDSLDKLTFDNPEQRELVRKLRAIVSARYQIIYQSLSNNQGRKREHFIKNAEKGDAVMQEFLATSVKMDRNENELLAKREMDQGGLEFATTRYIFLILLIFFFFQLISFFMIIQAFKRRREYQGILERKIKELNITNAELEQIAFVASHDLQEPLRKIRTFSDRLLLITDQGEETLKFSSRINHASERMQELINDLINYTHLIKSEEVKQKVSLNECIAEATLPFKDILASKKGTVKVGNLPEIFAFRNQLHLLFCNLIDNSIKFCRHNVPPVISIECAKTSDDKFVTLTFSDNGIGFKEEFSKKIFFIFQRLHAQQSEYAGKGIGLAICKRVMMNHGGNITATVRKTAEGAIFHLQFPTSQEG